MQLFVMSNVKKVALIQESKINGFKLRKQINYYKQMLRLNCGDKGRVFEPSRLA
tara:strand:- start:719 stop:880 length:162 start_codon:yes stop_codon:yes gene_type:complete